MNRTKTLNEARLVKIYVFNYTKLIIGKEVQAIATSTFERKIIINNPKSLKHLEKVMADPTPKKPIWAHPFSSEDRKRGEALLKRCQLHSHS